MPKRPHEKYMQAAHHAVQQDEYGAEAPNPEGLEGLEVPKGEELVIGAESVFGTPYNLEALCKEHFCPICPEKAALDEERLRTLAEMENFKKRLMRERDEQWRYAGEGVLIDILPTLDNLDLALQYASTHEACKDMLTGVQMTRKLLGDALQQHGLAPVGEAGEVFTPERHEAIAFDERDDMDDGLVSKVLQQGYMLKDRLLRPAKVSVSKRV